MYQVGHLYGGNTYCLETLPVGWLFGKGVCGARVANVSYWAFAYTPNILTGAGHCSQVCVAWHTSWTVQPCFTPVTPDITLCWPMLSNMSAEAVAGMPVHTTAFARIIHVHALSPAPL